MKKEINPVPQITYGGKWTGKKLFKDPRSLEFQDLSSLCLITDQKERYASMCLSLYGLGD